MIELLQLLAAENRAIKFDYDINRFRITLFDKDTQQKTEAEFTQLQNDETITILIKILNKKLTKHIARRASLN